MAAVQATRTYLRAVIGLGVNAEGTARANTIISEGLDNLDDLHELADDDGIKPYAQMSGSQLVLLTSQDGHHPV